MILIPVLTLSPTFRSHIFIDSPFSTSTVATDGKQFPDDDDGGEGGGGGGDVPKLKHKYCGGIIKYQPAVHQPNTKTLEINALFAILIVPLIML